MNEATVTLDARQAKLALTALKLITPVGAKPETSKARLEWYERSELITTIERQLDGRKNRAKKTDAPPPEAQTELEAAQ